MIFQYTDPCFHVLQLDLLVCSNGFFIFLVKTLLILNPQYEYEKLEFKYIWIYVWIVDNSNHQYDIH